MNCLCYHKQQWKQLWDEAAGKVKFSGYKVKKKKKIKNESRLLYQLTFPPTETILSVPRPGYEHLKELAVSCDFGMCKQELESV